MSTALIVVEVVLIRVSRDLLVCSCGVIIIMEVIIVIMSTSSAAIIESLITKLSMIMIVVARIFTKWRNLLWHVE
jgi:hypothetical protein